MTTFLISLVRLIHASISEAGIPNALKMMVRKVFEGYWRILSNPTQYQLGNVTKMGLLQFDLNKHIKILGGSMCQGTSYGPWSNMGDSCQSFLVHALERTRYSKDKMVIGRTSIILFVTSFFLGVTIFASFMESGHSHWPSRKLFQSSTSLLKRSMGTQVSRVVSIHNIPLMCSFLYVWSQIAILPS